MPRILPNKPDAVEIPACHVSDCPLTVDLVLKTSDGKKLGAHSRNLEVYNTAFPCLDSVTHRIEDLVELAEDAETLKLLLEYSHNCKHSDLRKLDVDVVIAFATAAEKYGNFFASEVCKVAMRDFQRFKSANHSLAVLAFRAFHGDLEEIERLAGRTVNLPLSTVWTYCKKDPLFFYIWTEFREQWRISQKVFSRALNKTPRSSDTETKQLKIIRALVAECVVSRFDVDALDNAITTARV
ncbi:hypothetical protein E1B28_010634 [Marasmius oreades]|uniref:BTB domain-containing protein n=1 Tax=Marasmius oreades TaxID=181124 RepID=A0A9P7RY70_9AGAR|nr:uncharacterized protein E1B28_010634 [Marasmius oreades]KAG7091615.1 hypothetical protein E1B28_010634 [Marasmius oreades]